MGVQQLKGPSAHSVGPWHPRHLFSIRCNEIVKLQIEQFLSIVKVRPSEGEKLLLNFYPTRACFYATRACFYATRACFYPHKGLLLPPQGLASTPQGLASTPTRACFYPHKGLLLPHKGLLLPHKGLLLRHKGLLLRHKGLRLPHKGLLLPHKGFAKDYRWNSSTSSLFSTLMTTTWTLRKRWSWFSSWMQ